MAEDGQRTHGSVSTDRKSGRNKKVTLQIGQLFLNKVRLHHDFTSTLSDSLNPTKTRITRHGTSKSSSRACARASRIAFRIRSSSNSSALCSGSRSGRPYPSSVIEYHIDIRARMSLCAISLNNTRKKEKNHLRFKPSKKVVETCTCFPVVQHPTLPA